MARGLIMMLLALALMAEGVAAYEIGHRSLSWTDPERGNRAVPAEVYYPADAAGENVPVAVPPDGGFPVLSFGHGFLMGVDVYDYLWEGLIPEGYVMVLPRTEGSLLPPPDHLEFGRDLAFLLRRLEQESADPASPFHQRISERGAVMGHSMGGGASVLAAAEDPSVDALCNLAAAETSPSAIAAAASVTVPSLLLAGSLDCVTPPAGHQIPIYEALASDCRALVTLEGGSHCQFAAYNFNCSLGEIGCDNPTLGRAEQHDLVLQLLHPWLDGVLGEDAQAWQDFLALLESSPQIGYQLDCASTGLEEDLAMSGARLLGVHPNPFNPRTCVNLELPSGGAELDLSVHDLTGRRLVRIHQGFLSGGSHRLTWKGRDGEGRPLPTGVYLLRLECAAGCQTCKLTLLK